MPAYISIADNDDAGEWAAVLPFCLNIKCSDYAPSGLPDGNRLAAPLAESSFHAPENDRD